MSVSMVMVADLDSRFFAMVCGSSVRHDADVASLKIA